MSDQAAAVIAHAHIELTRFFADLREVFEAIAVAARELVEALRDLVLIDEFRVWRERAGRKLLWLDRGRPAPLVIDGHAYRRRRRARMRKSGR